MAKVLLKVAPPSGDPNKPAASPGMLLSPTTKSEMDLDLRDKLSELAVKGNSLKPDDKAAIYGYLTSTLGRDKAQKLINHAYIFNSRPDVQNLSPEDKLKSFYTIGSTDPDIQAVLGRTKNLGYGILPGYRSSVSDINQAVQEGRYGQGTAGIDPEIQKKVMLKISK